MKKVLIVDDALYMRNKIHKAIEAIGLEVVGQAGDGFEALEQFEKLEPDLVTLDITMPFMSGIEVLQRMKVARPDVKVVIVAANGAEQSVKEAILNGADNFLMKPFEDEDLQQIVKACLNGGI